MGSDLLKLSHLAGDRGSVRNENRLSLPPLTPLELLSCPYHLLGLTFSVCLKRGIVPESEGRVVF